WWMPELWQRYDEVPEQHYASIFLANCMSRCTLRLGVLDEDNRRGPAFEEDGKPVKDVDPAMAALGAKMISSLRAMPKPGTYGAPAGGQATLLARMGANLGTVAECFLLGWEEGSGKDRVYRWEVVSTEEIRPIETKAGEPQMFYRRRSRYLTPEIIQPTCCLRIFRSHPRFSAEPDTANRALMDTLERLHLLNQEGVADSKSRLAGPGLLLMPSEIDFPDAADGVDGAGYVQDELIATGNVSISDPSGSGRHTPVVMGVPGDQVANFRLIKFGDDSVALVAKRDAAVTDYARGAEFPPEITRGFSDTSFANAYAVTESTSRLHVEPWLDVVAGCLTADYLIPGLLHAAGLAMDRIPPPRIAKLCVWYDVSGLVSHANPEKVAAVGYGTAANPNDLISGRTWRRLNGLTEADAPGPKEWDDRVDTAHTLRLRSELGAQKPGQTADPTPTPEGTDEGIAEVGPNVDEEMGKRVAALADYVIREASKRAGAWLRAKASSKPEYSKLIDGIPNVDVARHLGPQVVDALGGLDAAIGPAQFSSFESTVREWLIEAGREDAAAVAAATTDLVSRFTRSRLYSTTLRLDAGKVLELVAREP
ncbi:MAG TPA: hypothetical protein VF244_06920, partial [Acidimicrobiales bacterium]